MSLQNVQQLLDKARREFDLHNDNAHALANQAANLNQQLQQETQKCEREKITIEKSQSKEGQKFQKEETAYTKVRADYEKARKKFEAAQQEFQSIEQKFRASQTKYDAAYAEHNKDQQKIRSTVSNVVDASELQQKRIEQQLERIKQEERTEQTKASNARRDIDIFNKQLIELRTKTVNDTHAPHSRGRIL